MNNRNSVLKILFGVFVLILLYNFFLAPIMMQYGSGMRMGMGMYRHMYNSYFVDLRWVVLIGIILLALLLLQLVQPHEQSGRCKRCGKVIESNLWKVCPTCGAVLNNRKGEK